MVGAFSTGGRSHRFKRPGATLEPGQRRASVHGDCEGGSSGRWKPPEGDATSRRLSCALYPFPRASWLGGCPSLGEPELSAGSGTAHE